ncbi:MAG: molecular chaperone TorD family protein [Actinobacteria bacterium]|nr:molecular chaperone TorD family protein [Actinomycetota bacterium]
MYRALARGFTPPEAGAWAERIADDLADAAGSLAYGLTIQPTETDPAALEAAYFALFEIGGAEGGPCFLHEGEHGGGRMKVLDDTLRFYHHFGLRLSSDRHDRPDHLATEMEFMHALTFREAAAARSGADPEPLRRAQRDFLRFHLVPFSAAVAGRLARRDPSFYRALAAAAAAFCRQDLDHLESR